MPPTRERRPRTKTSPDRRAPRLPSASRVLASLFEAAPHGMGVVRAEAQEVVVLSGNAAMANVLGARARDLEGLRLSSVGIGPAALRAWYRRLRESERRGGPVRFELPRHADSEERWIEASARFLGRDEGHGLLGSVLLEDVTDRHRASAALRDGEARYRRLTQAVSHYVYNVKIDGGRPVETTHSPACVAVTGYTADELRHDPWLWLRMVAEKDRPRVLRQCNDVLDGRTVEPIEHRIVRKDGAERWVRSTLIPRFGFGDRLLSYDGIIEDVTERRRAEEALRRAERSYREMLDNLHLIAVMLDLEGRIAYCNPYFARLAGYPRSEPIIGRNWFDEFVPVQARARVREIFLEAVRTGYLPVRYENEIVGRGGAQRLIVWNNTVLRDADGRVTGSASIGEDVTDHRRLERQFLQAQKMESIGLLAGGVAHDFNNLLTAILGHAELALGNLDPGDPRAGELREVVRAATRGASLTRQLLAFSRRHDGAPRLVDIDELVRDLEPMLRRLLGEDIVLEIRGTTGSGRIHADPAQIEQVLVNLAVNARDAMPGGGELVVELRELDHAGGDAPGAKDLPPGSWLSLSVRDSGAGIGEDVMPHLFEPFFTTKEPGRGTGLGLATCLGIVQRVGGTIGVESRPGQGSSFHVYLPRAQGDLRRVVLVAERDPVVREGLAAVLRNEGFVVAEVADAADARERLADAGQAPDVILADVDPGDPSRRVAADAWSLAGPGIEVVVVSEPSAQRSEDSRRSDPDAVLAEQLAQRVRSAHASRPRPLP